MAKNWSDLCNFYSKVIFWIFYDRKYHFFFFVGFKLLMFHNNIVKTSEKMNKQNLLKICLQATYRFLHNLHSILLWEKVKTFDFLKKRRLE